MVLLKIIKLITSHTHVSVIKHILYTIVSSIFKIQDISELLVLDQCQVAGP